MAELLFVTPQEMTSSTILSGNTDTDKYLFCILNTQLTTIEPLLGSELYDKIISDIEAETLTGLYLELYADFIKPITKNEALAQDKDEVQYLSGKYKSLAQMYVTRFEKWICKNPLIEYKTIQDEVNALKNINLNVGWKL